MFPSPGPQRSVALVVAVAAAALGLTGCSVDASQQKPESKSFRYAGTTLKLTTHEVATDLVAADRSDIKVTRWFDAAAGSEHLTWTLKGDTLDIDAGCSGIAFCDAKFRVEVPRGIAVTKDGRRTGLTGRKPAPTTEKTAPENTAPAGKS
ncbi:hypothetical protein BX264_3901 [Streptomyces sp. 2333.5]|uniref:hypothetical protein n=1 Tax=unclassified Streptomyces TaxID=2593676 RepID=UPI000899925E|nr:MULTISPECIES: hypothetical protein [unclassified Streptomyces]PJJ03516.1 hypothetical protein BX264_3901 [Streptomyces sp. 2333.5]SED36665.1 hypothetical protein SAMN05428943_3483 [Streptomyces sp. 2314.4]SEE48534.1 hypothetical protein SAMN05428942_4004 [Streptomyces sp. 2112.2]SOE12102.1 hypothetical protein SAMN06272775_3086 [Streptomyces sp. 2323.1]